MRYIAIVLIVAAVTLPSVATIDQTFTMVNNMLTFASNSIEKE